MFKLSSLKYFTTQKIKRNLLKNSITTSSFILLSLFSFSCWCFPQFYFGLGAGPETIVFKQTSNIVRNSPFALTNFNILDTREIGGKGAFLSLFTGASVRFNAFRNDCEDLYLGLELNVNGRTVKSKASTQELRRQNFSQASYKMRREYGVSLIPGYMVTDCTLFYARVGYARGTLNVYSSEDNFGFKRKHLDGLRYGLGIKQDLSDCFSVRLEANLINYRRAQLPATEPLALTTRVTKIRPYSQRVEIGFIYNL
jgi:outer membrane immunogenic protein